MSTIGHPETDGQTERANRAILDTLRSYCLCRVDDWSAILPLVEFAMNNAAHASTGYTPCYLNGLHRPQVSASLSGGISHLSGGGTPMAMPTESDLSPDSAVRPLRVPEIGEQVKQSRILSANLL